MDSIDGGAPVVNDEGMLIGLISSGNTSGQVYVTPIGSALEAFGVERLR